ncbi:hypothetical protein K1719_015904 [Acacia pycnantha]|nr:hypothetical protein K1719_015904 [Acacia pycnantha]
MLVSSSLDSTCEFWNLLEGTLLRTMTFPCSINGVAISSSDSSQYYLFAEGSDGHLERESPSEKNQRFREKNWRLMPIQVITWNLVGNEELGVEGQRGYGAREDDDAIRAVVFSIKRLYDPRYWIDIV